MLEEWKCVDGYAGLYDVNNLGRVRNSRNGKIKKQRNNGHGYMQVNLWIKNKGKMFYVHRLVAIAFIPSDDKTLQINHLDEVKNNNFVENLEWVTCKENNNYGNHTKRIKANDNWQKSRSESMRKARQKSLLLNSKRIVCIDTNNNETQYPSAAQAARDLGLDKGAITRVANGKYNHTHGYRFKYVD